MRYRVTFRKRFDQTGEGSDAPQNLVNVADGVIEDAVFVEQFEPDSLHVEEGMEEDDDFLAFGSEVWEYEIAGGRDKEFKDALLNSEVVMEVEEMDTEPAT